MDHRFILLAAVFVVVFLSPLSDAAVYKCVDSDNHVTFSQTPCINQSVETLEPIAPQNSRLQRIDYERWLGASRDSSDDAYWIARYAFEAHEDIELAQTMASLAQRLGHSNAEMLLRRVNSRAERPLQFDGEARTQLAAYVASMTQARINAAAKSRDEQRQQDMDNIAIAIADYALNLGIDALGQPLVDAGAIELACDNQPGCSTAPGLVGNARQSGFAANTRMKTCAPRAIRPCLRLENFMSIAGGIPADSSRLGKVHGFHVIRSGHDQLWVTSTRAETLEVLAVGIKLQ